MKLQLLKNQTDYQIALERLEELSPIAAIKFRMEQEGLTQKDLIPAFGDKTTVSKILKGRRKLTVENIRALHKLFNIPLESLVGVKVA